MSARRMHEAPTTALLSPTAGALAVVALAAAAAASVLGCDCLGRPAAAPPEDLEGELSVDPELTLGLPPEVAQRTIAVVDGEELRVLDVAREIEAASPMVAAQWNDATRRRALVERMVRERALAAEARERGLDADPRVARAREELLVRALVAQVSQDVPRPSADEVRRYYDEHRDRYRNPPLRSVGLIFTRDRAAAEAGIVRMQADARHLNRLWHEVAAEIGFMGPLDRPVQETEMFAATPRPTEGMIPQTIRDIAFAGEIGTLHPEVVPHGDGFYVVRILSGADAVDVSFGDVRASIEQELHDTAIDARVTEIVSAQLEQATLDDEAIDSVRLPAPTLSPLPVPEGSPRPRK